GNAPRYDGVADGVRVRSRLDQGICRPELAQPVDVAVADHRLARLARPAPRRPIKVCLTGEHGVAFDGIKKMTVSIQTRPEAAARRKERMRSDNQAAAALLQAFKIGKCAHIF